MQNHVFKSPFRDGEKVQFAHQRYTSPSNNWSADYDTAKKKFRIVMKNTYESSNPFSLAPFRVGVIKGKRIALNW